MKLSFWENKFYSFFKLNLQNLNIQYIAYCSRKLHFRKDNLISLKLINLFHMFKYWIS